MLTHWLTRRRRGPRTWGARFRPGLMCLEDRTAPSGVPTSWAQRGVGGGGALFSPQVSPFNASEVYVASDMSELFHSSDNGASWKEVDSRQVQGSHETQVQFTDDPNTLYTIDYTSLAGVDHQRPTKSTDGGQTWHPLTNDPTGDGAFKIFADPANHNRVLLSDYTHLFFSGDGGATWGTRYTTSNNNAGLHLAGAFFDGSNIYVGSNSGLLASADGGATFTVANVGGIPAAQAILSFAGAKQGNTTRFFAVTKAAVDVYAGIQGWDYGGAQSIYTLDWGQANWTASMTGINNAVVEPFYVGMAHNNIGVAYVAGGSTAGTPTIYKTADGGQTWGSVFQTASNQNIATGWQGANGDKSWTWAETALGFTVAGNDANHVVITDYGFAHGSTDGGTSWQALYVPPADRNPTGANTPKARAYHDSGLDNTTSWGVAWVDANNVLTANSDIFGSHSTDGGQTFAFPAAGVPTNSLYRLAVAGNTVYAATSSVHDLYQSTHLTDASIDGGGGSVMFSTDKGASWQTMHNFGHVVSWVATDPTNANRLYASVVSSTAGGIYVTNNAQAGAGSTWSLLPAPPRTQGHAFDINVLSDGTLVVSFSGRRAGSPVNFTASSGVFMSSDGGQTWADRTDAGMKYWTQDVVVDPFDATQNTWYAGVFGGWGGQANGLGGLYKTTDRGQHWTRLNTMDGVISVTFNPSDQNEMWMTTEDQGLWYSSNARAATPTFVAVASYPFRAPERVFYNPFNTNEIWVTSFGGGFQVGQVNGNTATGLAFQQQPTSAAAGGILTPAVTVRIVDGQGNTVPTANNAVTIAIGTNPGGSTLHGTLTVNANNGVATFGDLWLNKAAAGYTLTVTSVGLTGATSTTFTISPSSATGLLFVQQPSNVTAGAVISPAVTVRVVDNYGNTITSSAAAVTVAIGTNPGGGSLGGTTTVNAQSGIATFGTLTVSQPGTGYTLAMTSPGLGGATSNPFNVTPAGAVGLAFGQQPTNVVAGAAISPAVTVRVVDGQGNTVSGYNGPVTVALAANPGGSTLGGTTTVNAVSGVASFSTLTLNKVGTGYTLAASAPGLSGATSAAFGVLPSTAATLAFVQQPPNGTVNAVLTPAVTVKVLDAFGNLVTGSSAAVTVALGANPGGAVLGGTLTVNAANGLATFSTLTLDKPGTGYTLAVSSPGLGGATSNTFNISTVAVGSISGVVFLDVNSDGVRESSDLGVPGQTVYLDLNNNGRLDSNEPSAVTGLGGAYSFANLAAGPYVVRQVVFGGTVLSGPAGGSYGVTVSGGSAVTDRNFGDVPASSVTPVHVSADLYGPHPNSSADVAFVKGVYRAVLGRDADPAGLSAWLGSLAAGTPRWLIAKGIWGSTEHRGQEVDSYYRTYLGRSESSAEQAAWVGSFLAGADETAVAQGFLTSPEYANRHAGNTAFVNALYLDLLGRVGDPGGVAFYVNYLNNGGSRRLVVQGLMLSPESAGRAVDGDYYAYLHRPSDATARQNLVSLVTAGTIAFADVVFTLIGSGEFYANGAAGVP